MSIKLKLNMPFQGFAAGREITVKADANGVPLEKFWRRRLKDAVSDNCVEIVSQEKPKKSLKEAK